MKRTKTIVLCALGLVVSAYLVDMSVQRVRELLCPSLEKLKTADPFAEARAAHARGDDHLIMLGGIVGTIPGVTGELASRLPHVLLNDTSDTVTEGCSRLNPTAQKYASVYNQTIERLAGRAKTVR